MKNILKLTNFSFKKIILMLLILVVFFGMAVFGVTQYNRNEKDNYFLKIGDLSISSKMFKSEYSLITQQNAQAIAKNPYLASNILQSIVSRYASTLMFVNEANKVHLGASNDLIYKMISSAPYFQDENHKFNQEIFKTTVDKIYGSESAYINTLKNDIKQTQLTGILLNSVYQPSIINKLFLESLNQSRKVDYALFSLEETTKTISNPNDAELLTLLDNNKDKYTLPEFRSLQVLKVNVYDYIKSLKVNDKEIIDYYNSNPNNFMSPETRDITQVLLNNEKDANDLFNNMKDSSALKEIKANVTNLTNLTRTSLPDNLSSVIFTSKVGSLNAPVKTNLGYHIIVVTKINPSKPLPITSVKKRIETEIIGNKLSKLYKELKNNLSKESGTTNSLVAIQKNFKSNLTTIKKANSYGFDDKNNLIPELSQNSEIIKTAFSLPLNQISDVIVSNNVFYLIKTTAIHPTRLLSLSEAKPELIKQWKYKKAEGIIKNKAESFVGSLNLKQNTKNLNVKINTITISRNKLSTNTIFNNKDLDRLFLSSKNVPIEGVTEKGDIYVAVIKDIYNNTTVLNASDNSKIVKYVSDNFKEDILTQLFSTLGNNYKVDLNKELLNSMFNGNN